MWNQINNKWSTRLVALLIVFISQNSICAELEFGLSPWDKSHLSESTSADLELSNLQFVPSSIDPGASPESVTVNIKNNGPDDTYYPEANVYLSRDTVLNTSTDAKIGGPLYAQGWIMSGYTYPNVPVSTEALPTIIIPTDANGQYYVFITISPVDGTDPYSANNYTYTGPITVTGGGTAPTVTINQPTSDPTYPTSSSTIDIGGTATADPAVTSVTWANNRGGSGTCNGTTSWSKSGITLYSGQNVITVTANNTSGSGTDTLTVTYTPPSGPTVTMTTTASNPTFESPIPITVTFSKSVTGFDASDVNVANAVLSGFSGSGSSYSFDLGPSDGQLSTVTANIAAGVAHDTDGNGNQVATPFNILYVNTTFIVQPNIETDVLAGRVNGMSSQSRQLYFTVLINFGVTLDPSEEYYVRFDLQDQSHTPDEEVDGNWNTWNVYVQSDHLLVDENTHINNNTIDTYPLSHWPAAHYRWALKRSRFVLDETICEGDFHLANVRILYSGVESQVPVLFAAGISGVPDMWYMDGQEVAQFFKDYRPVYLFDYPNTGDIPTSADLLDLALQYLNAFHSQKPHVVAHSMGGVVSRYYYQQHYSQGNYLIDKLVTLGSPFEGSVFAKDANDRVGIGAFLTSISLDHGENWSWFKPLGNVGTPAARQLSSPQNELQLWKNDHAAIANNTKHLAMCGSDPRLPAGATVGVIFAILSDAIAGLANPATWIGGTAATRRMVDSLAHFGQLSDGVVRWGSACKAPIRKKKNIYPFASHLTYTAPAFEGRSDMLATIEKFLEGQQVSLERDPVTETLNKTKILIKTAGKKVANAFIGTYDATTRQVKRILSTMSDAAGEVWYYYSVYNQAMDDVYVIAPGFKLIPLASVWPMRQMKADGDGYIIELEPDPEWQAPFNGSVTINNDALTTVSPVVNLDINCENATGMSIQEFGSTNPPAWEAYNTTRTYTFSDTAPGDKTIVVAFRNTVTNGPSASDNIILVDPTATGGIKVEDPIGEALIVFDTKVTSNRTPATISGLAMGTYRIGLIKNEYSYDPLYQDVEVFAGQITNVTFRLYRNNIMAADYDGDGKTDPAVLRLDSGTISALLSASGYSSTSVTFNVQGIFPVSGDFDGDGKSDFAVYYRGGTWHERLSSDGSSTSVPFGMFNTLPVPADYDGDGKTDPAYYHEESGLWAVKLSENGAEESTIIGGNGWTPVVADYDGDGKADPAVYQDATGAWIVMRSSYQYAQVSLAGFGGSGFVPVVADYDGDGKADPGIYYQTSGLLKVLLSGSGYQSATAAMSAGAQPLIGDFDGDGKTDLATYQEAAGQWNVMLSASSYAPAGVRHGGPGLVPVQ